MAGCRWSVGSKFFFSKLKTISQIAIIALPTLTHIYIITELTLLSHHFEFNDAKSSNYLLGTCQVSGDALGAPHI